MAGFYSQITRFPNDGLGTAVLVNEDSTFTWEAIRFRIAEGISVLIYRLALDSLSDCITKSSLGCRFKSIGTRGERLNPFIILGFSCAHFRFTMAWKAFLEAVDKEEAGRLPSPPDAPLPDATLDGLSAAYRHPAYGCVAFRVTGDGIMRANVADWGGLPSTLALQHFSGNLFNATVILSVAILGHEELLEQPFTGLQAEFEVLDGVVQGFGLWGGLWGAGPASEPLIGHTARERAEVWFDREVCMDQDGSQVPLVS